MIKDKFKKILSMIMAFLICFTSFVSTNVTTVNASAEVYDDVIMVEFPRSGDANSGADWGYGDMEYMNGWNVEAFPAVEFRMVGSWMANIAYCIEPGVYQQFGNTYAMKDERFMDDFPAELNRTLDANEIKLFLGRVLYYGFHGDVDSTWKTQYSKDLDEMSHAYATQILVWETIVGERDLDFNHVDTGSYNRVLEVLGPNHPLRTKTLEHYNEMVRQVQNHAKRPSFMKKSEAVAKAFEMAWNGNEYSTTFTDTNNVLGNYEFSTNNPQVKTKVSGDKLIVTSKEAPTTPVLISAVKNKTPRKSLIIWSDGMYQPCYKDHSNKQDMVTYGQEIKDPVYAYVNVKASYGSMEILKTSEDNNINGVKFSVVGNGVNEVYSTDSKGSIKLENLKPGTYTITEISKSEYVPQSAQEVTVIAGQNANVYFNNTLKRGELVVTKTSEDKVVKGIKFKLSGTSLSGDTFNVFAITDSSGKATFENVLVSGDTPYIIEEVDTAERYIIPSNQNINIKWNETTNASFYNELKRGSMTIEKSSEDNEVNNVKFTITGKDYTKTFTTNAEGIIKVDNLLPGTYEVREIVNDEYIPQDVKTVTVLASKDTSVSFSNSLKRGDLKITKTAEDHIIKDVKFKLSGTSMSGYPVEMYATTNESGIAIFKDVLISGEEPYLIEELNVDGRYEPVASQHVKVGFNEVAEKSFYNKLKRGDLKIIKTSEDGEIEGITFEIRGTDYSKSAKTNENGEILIEGLLPGRYEVEEVVAPEYKPQKSKVVEVEWNKVSEVNFENILKRGTLEVTKSAEDSLSSGIEFKLTGTSMSGDPVEMYATTNDLGVATFENVLISGDTTYTLEEVDTAIRYVIPDNQEVQINWNEVTNKNFSNILKKWNISVSKQDSEFTNPQADAKLSGAVYGIYKDNVLLDEYTTDVDGKFTTKYYVCGSGYTLKEIKPSEGYLLDETTYDVGLMPGEVTIELNPTSKTVNEDVIKGHIAITKTKDTDDTQIQVPEANAEFDIYLKSAGSYANAKETERDHIVTDKEGYAFSKYLPYGTYTVSQTKTEEGLELIADFDVFVNEDGKVYRYVINNARFYSYIRVGKVDSETGNLIPYKGTEFQIYYPDGNLVTFDVTYPEKVTIDTFLTDSNGILITPAELPYGKGYKLVEVKAPYGYVLDSTPIYFDLTKDNITVEDNRNILDLKQDNLAQKGKVTIDKQGQMFIDVSESGEDTKIYQPVYGDGYLKNATFEVYALEDIITPDGTKRYSKDELVDTITTNDEGKAQSKELYLGKYYVKETVAPIGFVLNEEVKTFELVYGNQSENLVFTSTSYYNQRKQVEISLLKEMELNEEFGIGNNDEVANVTFGLYAAEDIKALNDKVIPTDGLIEIVSVSKDGKATFTSDLPVGKYYVKEIATDKQYIVNDNKYPFEFTYADDNKQLTIVVVNDNKAIANEIIYGDISGLKVDGFDEPLANATIGLFKANETEFSKETAIRTTISDSEGKFEFTHIPYGNYLVKEIKAPKGYVLDDSVKPVTIDKNKQVVEIKVTNTRQKLEISLIKDMEVNNTFGIGNNQEVINVTFGLYADEEIKLTNDKTLAKDELIEIASVDKDGKLTFTSILPIGKYYVKEVSTDIHYLLNENKYPVSSEGTEDNALVIPLVSNNGKAIENKLLYGSVSGLKVNYIGKPLANATIGLFKADETIFDKDHAVYLDTSDRYGKFEFDNLPYGNYLIKEVKAPKGYVLSDSIYKVSISEDKQVVDVVVNNERQKIEISLIKDMEVNDTFDIGKNNEITNVTFGLYANEDVYINEDKTIKKDELIEVAGVNQDGKLTFNTLLPIGKYYVKEISTDKHYLLNENKYVISSEGTEDNIPVIKLVANNNKAINNDLLYGSVSGIKLSEDGKKLPNATIGLFKADEEVFDEKHAIFTSVSDENGRFSLNKLPYGTYIVREIKAPTGYLLSGETFNVNITKDQEVIEIKLVNEAIKGNVTLTKVDVDYPDNKLTGATFEIYKDSNNNNKFDRNDKYVGDLKEVILGTYAMNDLVYGRYFLKETKAPEGFLLDKEVYSFFIEEDGKTYEVENKDGIGFINNPMEGKLKIVKTSSDGVVEGFAFKITGPENFEIVLETDANGEIKLDGLRIGEYTISEVLNAKSSAYKLPKDKLANVQLDSLTIVKMHNVYKDTPQTGDDRNISMWYGVAAISAIGIVVTAIVSKNKKIK